MKKRLLKILILICFCVMTVMGVIACKQKEAIYKINDDGETCTITNLSDYRRGDDVRIPTQIDGLKVTAIGSYALQSCWSVKRIIIPEGIERIEMYAFRDCQYIEELIIPNTVNSIGDWAFEGCIRLMEIRIPNSVTSIGGGLFMNSSGLTVYCEAESCPDGWNESWNSSHYYNIIYPTVWDCNHNDVADDGYIYTIQNGLKYGIKDGFATLMRQGKGKQLINIDSEIVYKGNIYKLTNIGQYAFEDSGETEILLPNGITTIEENAFLGGKITSIILPNTLKTIGESAFSGCRELTSVVIFEGLTNIGEFAFSNCEKLLRITVPRSVVSIGRGAFYNCYGLININYNATECADIEDKTTFACAGRNGNGITVTIGANVKRIPARLFASRNAQECPCVVKVMFENESVCQEIGEEAFRDCNRMKSVNIPDSVVSIKALAFIDCSSLMGIVIPDSVETIERNAFKGCSNVISLRIGKSLTSIGEWVFAECSSLTSVVIPDSVTSVKDYAFFSCANLTSMVVGSGVTSVDGYAFYKCSNLSIVYYNGMQSDWEKLPMGKTNEVFRFATKYYYSETKPTEAGNFWHYDENGEAAAWAS